MSQLEQLGMFATPEPTPKPKPATPANATAIDRARFARTHVRTDGPATSAAAAIGAAETAGSHCDQIAAAMGNHPEHGWTASELAEVTRFDRYQINRRLPDLIRAGRVHRDGSTRLNGNGNPEHCHYLTESNPA